MTTPIRLLVVSEMSAPRHDVVLVDQGHLRRFADYGDGVALTWTITQRSDRAGLTTPLPDDIDVVWLPRFGSSKQFVKALPATCRALWTAVGEADAVLVNVPCFPAVPALAIARLRGRPAVALQVARWAQLRVRAGITATDTAATRVLSWLAAMVATVVLVHGEALVDDLPRRARRKVELVTLSSLDVLDGAGDLPRWLAHEPLRLVTVARLIRTKRVDVIIDALGELRRVGLDAHLVIAGDGPERAAVEAHITQAGLEDSVTMLGWIDDSHALHDHLRQADVFLFASEDEGLPLAVLEAMAMGAPVVSTTPGGLATFLRHDVDSLVVPYGDVPAIVAAVGRLLSEVDLPDRLREEALGKVRPLTRQAFVARLLDVLWQQLGRSDDPIVPKVTRSRLHRWP